MADNNQDKEEKMTQFCDVTGADRERATFYLESANWTLQLALASFYEQDDSSFMEEDDVVQSEENIATDQSKSTAAAASGTSETSGGSGKSEKKTKSQPTTSGPRIATIHNMANNSSDDEDEQGQAFYTGTERSGQQILGPPRKNPIKDYVSEIFRSAQESGAEMVDPSTAHHTHPSTSSGRSGGGGSGGGSRSFSGSGYRLGQTNDDHIKLPDPSSSRPSRPANSEPVTLKLWRQGFSINDGELRLYEEPGNKEFLESIKKGEIPLELRQQGGSMVNLDLEDHRHEEYKQVSVKVKPFAGKGHTLGSPAPTVVSGSPQVAGGGSGSTVAHIPPTSNPEEDERRASEQLNVNPELPTTMIQVRLANGSRISVRFNHSHTINDIRTYITTARPEYANTTFALLTTYPSKELSDGDQTIDKAGILNAALMQRLK